MPRLLLHVEVLEDRSLPSVFTVTSQLDNGLPGTFRWAIIQANTHPNNLNIDAQIDEIHFNVPAKVPILLQLNAPLPPVTEPVLIDGFTQPFLAAASRDFDGPLIFLDGPLPQDPSSKENAIVRGIITNNDRVFPPIDKVPRPRPTRPDPGIVVPLLPKPKDEPHPHTQTLDQLFSLFGKDDLEPPPAPTQPEKPAQRIGGTEPGVFLPGQQELTGKILGELFEDYDGNGIRSPEEPPLPGRIVYLDLNHNGRYDEGEPATLTNEKGEYRFDDLRPGTYTVKQVLQPHLVQTLPRGDEGNRVGLHAGQTVEDVDFGSVRVQKRRVQVDTSSESQSESEPRPPADGARPDSQGLPGAGAALVALGWGLRMPKRDASERRGSSPSPVHTPG